jgi:hypothetical protein
MTDRQRLVSIIKHAILMGSNEHDTTGLQLAEYIADELLLNCDLTPIEPKESMGRRAPLTDKRVIVAN